jgi:hypothetical protein
VRLKKFQITTKKKTYKSKSRNKALREDGPFLPKEQDDVWIPSMQSIPKGYKKLA